MEQFQEVCRITSFVPKYTCICLDFVGGFGSYVKGLPKMKRCNPIAVSVPFQGICETSLIVLLGACTCISVYLSFDIENLT